MSYTVTKKPWLGAILVFVFGPFGFLYYSWKKVIVTLLLFSLPNMLLYALDSAIAEVVRYIIQLLMAVFAYLDLNDDLYVLEAIFLGILYALSFPISILNFLGAIAGGIWLLFLGQWEVVVMGFILAIIIPFAYSIVAAIQLPLSLLMEFLRKKNKKFTNLTIGFINIFIDHAIILMYVFIIVSNAIRIAESNNLSVIAFLLFGYGVATGPFSAMASEDDATGSILGVFVSQISYIILSIAYLFYYPAIAVPVILLIVFGTEILQLSIMGKIRDYKNESDYEGEMEPNYNLPIQIEKKVILILDDETTLTYSLQKCLESKFNEKEIEILISNDGNQALRTIFERNGKIDLVSTDINHPGIHGLELAEMIKGDYPHIKIIICSGFASESVVDKCNKIADYFFPKPFSFEDYCDKIEECLYAF